MARLVALGVDGLLQPGNSLIEITLLDHVGANVVVGIAKIGINFDSALALGNGIFELALKMIGPAEKSVRLGGRVQVKGGLVELDGAIVIALHLSLIGVLKNFPSVSKGLLIHGPLLPLVAQAAYGTEVPEVPKENLSFLTVVQVPRPWKIRKNAERLQFCASNGENKGCIEHHRLQHRREIVNRNFVRTGAAFATVALGVSLAIAGAAFAQTKTTKKAPAAKDPAAVKRGLEVFQQKCSTCHYDTSDAKKIGPGLKGIGKRGTFTVNNNKVTDENLKTWIENGDSLMPPFKDVLEDAQIKDVIAYVKTL